MLQRSAPYRDLDAAYLFRYTGQQFLLFTTAQYTVVAYADKTLGQLDRGCLKRIEFPDPYFKTEGNKAIALMGAYVDELLLIKKEDILKEMETTE